MQAAGSAAQQQQKQIVIGDVHGKVTFFVKLLKQANIFKDRNAEGTDINQEIEKLEQLEQELASIMDSLIKAQGKDEEAEKKIQRIADIIKDIDGIIDTLFRDYLQDQHVLESYRITMLGDLISDRGPLDYLILKILKKLKDENLLADILFSNHDIDAQKIWAKIKDDHIGITPAVKEIILKHDDRYKEAHTSTYNLLLLRYYYPQESINLGLTKITDDTSKLIDELYLRTSRPLKAIKFLVRDDKKKVEVLTHAPITWRNICAAFSHALKYIKDNPQILSFFEDKSSRIAEWINLLDQKLLFYAILNPLRDSKSLSDDDIKSLSLIEDVINIACLKYAEHKRFYHEKFENDSDIVDIGGILHMFIWQRYEDLKRPRPTVIMASSFRYSQQQPKEGGGSSNPCWLHYTHGHDGDKCNESLVNHTSLNVSPGRGHTLDPKGGVEILDGYYSCRQLRQRQPRSDSEGSMEAGAKAASLDGLVQNITRNQKAKKKIILTQIKTLNTKLILEYEKNGGNNYFHSKFASIPATATLEESMDILDKNLKRLQLRAEEYGKSVGLFPWVRHGASYLTLAALSKEVQELYGLIAQEQGYDFLKSRLKLIVAKENSGQSDLDGTNPSNKSMYDIDDEVSRLNKKLLEKYAELVSAKSVPANLLKESKPQAIPRDAGVFRAANIFYKNLRRIQIVDPDNNRINLNHDKNDIDYFKDINVDNGLVSDICTRIFNLMNLYSNPKDPDQALGTNASTQQFKSRK